MEVEAFQKQRHHQDTAPNKRAAQRAVADYKFGGAHVWQAEEGRGDRGYATIR